ncbi:DUF58 domain-containing protein [Aureimonas fodinaquatilis]|uniref:DUF58 domain-containing protein n=1 Tax=Aureimonas fodinaquatilis TaxID=2565783 RepID=A0A5B0DZ06_9HYPH|nr:DUF58 domain-containing protein [Aureimonas fodinaquatilis]KAA0972047.1 DUF58 domain-containing protein [Aureimonas fodinaquatilis]
MAALGATPPLTDSQAALLRARERAALIPDLLIEARRVVATVTTGWHGRRRRGTGENFWQFRPFVEGESVAGIDWRRSARDDSLYLRDKEWEAAQTVWLWADGSPSMQYCSKLALVSKESRALVLALALAEVLSRAGERVGFPGVLNPVSARNAAERIAAALTRHRPEGDMPDGQIRRFSELVMISDFLDPLDKVLRTTSHLAQRGVSGHLISVYDPAEEDFPYAGRTEFRDPETGARLLSGRADSLREQYRQLYFARRDELSRHCQRLGWSFLTHRTDHPASQALVHIHGRLSGGTFFNGYGG